MSEETLGATETEVTKPEEVVATPEVASEEEEVVE